MGTYEKETFSSGQVLTATSMNNIVTGIDENKQNISLLSTSINNLREDISEIDQNDFFVELDLDNLITQAENDNLPFSYFEELFESKKFVYFPFNKKEYANASNPSESQNVNNQGLCKLSSIETYGGSYWINFENITPYKYYSNNNIISGKYKIFFGYEQENEEKILYSIVGAIINNNEQEVSSSHYQFWYKNN